MTQQPEDRQEHDWGMCWCAECTRKLIKANDEYMQRWLDRNSRYDETPQKDGSG